MLSQLWPHIAGANTLIHFSAFLGGGIHALWQMDNEPVKGTSLSSQMMHRKTRTMEQILDSLVRGDMRLVGTSTVHMNSIGDTLDWYSTKELTT